MKKLIHNLLILFIFFISSCLYSQANWQWVTSFPNSVTVISINCVNNNLCFLGTSTGTIARSTNNGFSWDFFNIGNSNIIDDIKFVNDNTGYAVAGQYFCKTTNKGVNWTSQNLGISLYRIRMLNNDTMFISGNNGTILKTTNKGNNWITIQMPFSISIGNFSFSNTKFGFALKGFTSIGDPFVDYIFRTTDYGMTWAYNSFNYSYYQYGFEDVFYLDTLVGLASAYDEVNQYPYGAHGKIFRTTNSGQNWNQVFGVYLTNYCVAKLKFFNNQIGFSIINNIFLNTTNSGITWSSLCFIPDSIFIINYDFSDYNNGYIITSYGLLKTNNTGFIYAGENNTSLPSSFSLFQNYPNPFNPSTNIKYQIKENTIVTLRIYDILGKEIETLVNEKQSPGTYEVTWDASKYPSGVYFYKLTAGDFTETKKMVLLK